MIKSYLVKDESRGTYNFYLCYRNYGNSLLTALLSAVPWKKDLGPNPVYLSSAVAAAIQPQGKGIQVPLP